MKTVTKIYYFIAVAILLVTTLPVHGELAAWETEISASSPLNWYKLNESSGTTANDYGSADSNGTYGSAVVLGKTGPVGTGVQVLQADSLAGTIDLSQSLVSGDWTLEVLLKVPGVGVESVLISDSATPVRLVKLNQWPWDAGLVGYTQIGGFDAEFDYSMPLSQFVHLVFVADAVSGIELFADGVSQGTNANYMNLPREMIGGWSGGNEMFGIIDELVIYNRKLGSTEISDHYDAIPAQSEPPSLSGGRIVYHSYSSYFAGTPVDGNDGHVFIYSAADDSLTNVTTNLSVAYAMNPHFSPDGSKITFMATEPGDKNRRSELEVWVYDLAEGVLSQLMDDRTADEDPKFSTDGQKIVFKRNSQIWTINVDGTDMQQLTTSFLEKSGMNYSPDGSKMVYWVGSGAVANIWWIDSDGTDEEMIIGVEDIQEYYPIYRDAENIIYTRWDSTTNTYDKLYNYVISTQASTKLSINLHEVEDSDPFSIDSTFIGFSSSRASKGGWDIFMGDPVTGDVYTISDANINTNLHDLGGWYSPYDYARKLEMNAPSDAAQLIAGASYLLKVDAYSDGGVWSGASPSVKFEGPITQNYDGLVDDGTLGDETANDGTYSKTVTLPSVVGNYVVSSSALSEGTLTIVSASIDVTISEAGGTMHVQNIVCTTVPGTGTKEKGQASVTIYDNSSSPVYNAYVTGTFTGDFDETQSGYTDVYGVAVIQTVAAVRAPEFTFCVDDVTHETLTYDPNDNVVDCNSYPVP